MSEVEDTEIEPSHSVDDGVLPSPERIQRLSITELKELRDAVSDWTGPAAERFRARVVERLEKEGEGDT